MMDWISQNWYFVASGLSDLLMCYALWVLKCHDPIVHHTVYHMTEPCESSHVYPHAHV